MGGFDQLFDSGVAVHPPLDEAVLKSIPAKRGVFVLLAEDGRPILLTVAADIRARLRHRLTAPEADQCRKTADLREITAAVHWRLTHSRFETDWRFLEIARVVWPDTYESLLPRRPAWMVSIDLDEQFPHFAVVSAALSRGAQFGPFASRRAADRYIEILADAFDLCRCVSILRQSPHGAACAYKQMGRCAAPCDGSGSMADYRALLARAVEFVAGRRDAQRQRLAGQMRAAAAAMAYERAATVKSRLARLAEFDAPRFAEARTLDAFRFVIVQPGPSFHQASTFICDRGAIAAGPVLEFPPTERRADRVLAAVDRQAAGHAAICAEDRLRMGLLAGHLFADRTDRGLLFRRDEIDSAGLCAAIVEAAGAMKLRAPKRRLAKTAKATTGRKP